MALKKISLLFVISLVFVFASQNQVKDVPFEVNDVINQVSPQSSPIPNPQNLNPLLPTGEFLIDTSIVYVSAQDVQRHPNIAFDGTNYMVVWVDDRSISNTADIYGARVTPDGTLLDSAGIRIATAIGHKAEIFYYGYCLSIAFDGINYLVVWNTFSWYSIFRGIYGSRVSQSGTVLDTSPIPISTSFVDQNYPAVAFDGTNYLVVYGVGIEYQDVYGSRVTTAGVVLDTIGIPICINDRNQVYPSVAFNGTNYLVAWREGDIWGVRVSPAGNVLDTSFKISTARTPNGDGPSIASDGTNYLVVWTAGGYRREGIIYGARVTSDGVVLDTSNISISNYEGSYDPYVTFDGTNYFVIWIETTSILYGSRVTTAGAVLDTGFQISTFASVNYFDQRQQSVAFDGTNYLVVWRDRHNNPPDIYGARVTPSMTVLDTGIPISTATKNQRNSSIVFDGSNYLVVWQEDHSGNDDIYGVRVNQTGIVLDSSLIPISIAPNKQYSPSVAFGGTNYMVVWSDKRSSGEDIYGSRVSITGSVLDPDGIPISTASHGQFIPSIAFDGTNYFVVWQDGDGDASHICGARVDQDGIVLDPTGILISTVGNYQKSPSVAFDGNNYLVVWMSWWGAPNDPEIYCVRVDQQGNILPPFIQVTEGCFGYQKDPSVAFDGTNYFIVWRDDREANIYGARVSQTGIVLDPNGFAISTANYNQFSPSVAFDGTNFFVVWQDKRSGIYYDIYGAKVNQSGTVIEGYHVSTQSGDQLVPTITRGSGNELLITYTSWTDSINHRPVNTYRIWGKFASSCSLGITKQNPKVKMLSAKLLEVYPNPAKGVVRVCGPFSEKGIKIFDICGKMIKEIATTASQSRNNGVVVISLKEINPGIYFLQLETEIRKFLVVR